MHNRSCSSAIGDYLSTIGHYSTMWSFECTCGVYYQLLRCMTSEILRLHDLELCKRRLLTLLLRLQRRLLQVANLGTSSSRRTFIAFRYVRLETQIGTKSKSALSTKMAIYYVPIPTRGPPPLSCWFWFWLRSFN